VNRSRQLYGHIVDRTELSLAQWLYSGGHNAWAGLDKVALLRSVAPLSSVIAVI
jgi:hypothetical protein